MHNLDSDRRVAYDQALTSYSGLFSAQFSSMPTRYGAAFDHKLEAGTRRQRYSKVLILDAPLR